MIPPAPADLDGLSPIEAACVAPYRTPMPSRWVNGEAALELQPLPDSRGHECNTCRISLDFRSLPTRRGKASPAPDAPGRDVAFAPGRGKNFPKELIG